MTQPLTFAAYDALPGLSQSRLKPILVSPLEYQRALKQPRKDTPALRFGRAVDVAAFEPMRYALDFAVLPVKPPADMNLTTAEGKARRKAWNEAHPEDADLSPDDWRAKVWAAEHAGKTILSLDEHARAWECGAVLRSHPLTRRYFAGGKVQEVIAWTDKATGIACKGRIDLLPDCEPCIVDAKSTRSVDRAAFNRDIARFGYHFQGAFYRIGWHAMHGEWLPFKDIAVESFEPHDVGVFNLTGDALQRANDLVRQALDTFARCRDSGRWPGRYEMEEDMALPSWALPFDGDGVQMLDTDPADDVPLDMEG